MGKMPITVLEQINGVISDITENLDKTKRELLNCDPADPKAKSLEQEVAFWQERLNFLLTQRDKVQASGKTRYVYPFGTMEYFRQEFDDVKYIEATFIYFTKRILEVTETPSKKVRYMENLMKVYNEVGEQNA
ncbi:hypothetical protein [Brevibacillus sp. 179-C9.3 HS]|uniref:hypothetical protein n=1 Tax=unclassified Brevibacillus TaxID=2684853 RepID=UPI0039A0A8A6